MHPWNTLRRMSGAALVGVLLLTAPAKGRADVILDFGPAALTASDPRTPSNAQFRAQLVLFDEAFGNGFSFSANNSSSAPFALTGNGVRGFTASIVPSNPAVEVSLARFVTPLPVFSSGQSYRLSASGAAGGPISGQFEFNNTSSDFRVSFNTSTGFSGVANTDGDFRGCFFGPCTFSGAVRISVPEPGSLSLLAAGVLALAGTRRRRPAGAVAA